MSGSVYVIGAGASKNETNNLEIPMPLARDFFKEKYITNFWPSDSGVSFIDSSLYKVMNHYFNIAVNKRVNTEISVEEIPL